MFVSRHVSSRTAIPQPLVSKRVMAVPKYPSNLAIRQRSLMPNAIPDRPRSGFTCQHPPYSTLFSKTNQTTMLNSRLTGRDFRHSARGIPSPTAVGAASASVPSLSQALQHMYSFADGTRHLLSAGGWKRAPEVARTRLRILRI